MSEEKVILAALKEALDWAESRLSVNRPEALYWSAMRQELGAVVTRALHDAGYSIRRQGVVGTVKATMSETNYQAEMRVDADIRPSVVGAIQRFNAYEQSDAYAEHLAAMMPRILADVIARDLMADAGVAVVREFRRWRAEHRDSDTHRMAETPQEVRGDA
jgi:hypothetical protein